MDNVMAPQVPIIGYSYCPAHITEGCCPEGCVTPRTLEGLHHWTESMKGKRL